MPLLLDTHALLWFIGGDNQLSAQARKLIEDPSNRVMVSTISLVEMTIKIKLNKLSLKKPLNEIYRDIRSAFIEVLPISPSHLIEYQNVPLYAEHRDPFDRLIIATAVVEKPEVISLDPKFQYYKDLVDIRW
ncbi:type II toxin-antitoxin system VapC family toxin [Rhabdobacter roseus]|uniref:PIN domain nuclease of toxin-antitoxin system n=1 Tax=Rhabdobacter roseus TaxID=1655419 RepID=A0A840U3N2_9BACT|nr:type II toxin-antitoxin system VapC family toxin [Rhabdobacter roseus]MBB5286720.1 PIN domain nuclease of toxin-antitoxin system [Rhabdobacter roseus]